MRTQYCEYTNYWTNYHKQRFSLKWTYTSDAIKYLYSLGINTKLLSCVATVFLSTMLCP